MSLDIMIQSEASIWVTRSLLTNQRSIADLHDDAGHDVLEGLLEFSQVGEGQLHDRINPSVDLDVFILAVTEGEFYSLLHNGGDLVNQKFGFILGSS